MAGLWFPLVSLATADRQKDGCQGNWQDRTEWHNLVAFDPYGREIIRDYVKKGSARLFDRGQDPDPQVLPGIWPEGASDPKFSFTTSPFWAVVQKTKAGALTGEIMPEWETWLWSCATCEWRGLLRSGHHGGRHPV